jgi:hypothetical protein
MRVNRAGRVVPMTAAAGAGVGAGAFTAIPSCYYMGPHTAAAGAGVGAGAFMRTHMLSCEDTSSSMRTHIVV